MVDLNYNYWVVHSLANCLLALHLLLADKMGLACLLAEDSPARAEFEEMEPAFEKAVRMQEADPKASALELANSCSEVEIGPEGLSAEISDLAPGPGPCRVETSALASAPVEPFPDADMHPVDCIPEEREPGDYIPEERLPEEIPSRPSLHHYHLIPPLLNLFLKEVLL